MSGGSRIGTAATTTTTDAGLRAFRTLLHGCFGRRVSLALVLLGEAWLC
jgi:hypothetical protein